MRRATKALKGTVMAVASKALRLAGVNGLVAGVASHLFWRFIVVPIVKHARKEGRLKASRYQKLYVLKKKKLWHNLDNGEDQSPHFDPDRGLKRASLHRRKAVDGHK